MKITFRSNEFIEAINLSKGFLGVSYTRPILRKIHIVANDETGGKVRFEATNSAKLVRFYINAIIEEGGEALIEIPGYIMQFLRCFKKCGTDVVMYNEDEKIVIEVKGNVFRIDPFIEKYPNVDHSLVIPQPVESKPLICTSDFYSALQAMEKAGAKFFELTIQQDPHKPIRLVGYDYSKSPMNIEAIFVAHKKLSEYGF